MRWPSAPRRVALATLSAAIAGAACDREGPPRPQWLVHVGTDAPLPGFGDRVRLDIVDEAGDVCAECTRVFDLRGGDEVPLSFGVLPGDGPRWVRARLFRAEAIASSGEPTTPVLDVLGRLPALGDTKLDVRLLLGMDCFGVESDPISKATCDPASGEVTTDLVLPEGDASDLPAPGSWRGGADPCPADAPEGMVCVPGGTFLLGSRLYRPFGPSFDPVPEQLVRVSTFYLDVDEMTVATYRSLGGVVPEPKHNGPDDPYCAFTAAPGEFEEASLNCLRRDAATAACAALGKRLPTEAEWEYAAGGAQLESPYPWPLADPSPEDLCDQAVLGRAELLSAGSRHCLVMEPDLPVGPVAGGSPRDVSYLGIRNLGGNVAEWVADDFATYDDPACWGANLDLREDPRCEADDDLGVSRGGDWQSVTYNAHAHFRRSVPTSFELAFVGVRCARSIE